MGQVAEQLVKIKKQLPDSVELVAVSKYHSADAIMDAYNAGQRVFGENIVQEMRSKYELLPKDIEWHMIGHLQRNKVKYIAPWVSMIHAVDTYALMQEINKHAMACSRTIPCLLQLHVAQEETKFGFTIDECSALLEKEDWRSLSGVEIVGIMGMASHEDDSAQIKREFLQLRSFFEYAKEKYFSNQPTFCKCSWGMSSDYKLAIECGSNMVRVGSRIFGNREY